MTSIQGVHPYADKFPMLPDSELSELAESILQNGLRNPVVLTSDGLILDGRNRAKACEMAGVTPETITYDGDDLAEYVIDCNVTRRNMSTGARAMSAALVLLDAIGRDNGRWKYGELNSNDLGNSMAEYVRQCGVILDFKPDLAEMVVNESKPLDTAYKEANSIKQSAERDKIMERERRKREREEAAAEAERNSQIVADLTQADSKYLPMIESGDMTPSAAWAAHRADHKKELDQQAAERRNDEQRARTFCEMLHRAHDATYEVQREWAIRAIATYPQAVQPLYLELHDPTTIREIGQGLLDYAQELERTS